MREFMPDQERDLILLCGEFDHAQVNRRDPPVRSGLHRIIGVDHEPAGTADDRPQLQVERRRRAPATDGQPDRTVLARRLQVTRDRLHPLVAPACLPLFRRLPAVDRQNIVAHLHTGARCRTIRGDRHDLHPVAQARQRPHRIDARPAILRDIMQPQAGQRDGIAAQIAAGDRHAKPDRVNQAIQFTQGLIAFGHRRIHLLDRHIRGGARMGGQRHHHEQRQQDG